MTPPLPGAPLPAAAAFDPPPRLLTPRLCLRPIDDADADALLAVYGDPEVMRHASDPPFPDLGTVLLMLASIERLRLQGRSLEWAIAGRDDDGLIGTCGLHGFDPAAREAEVGCLLRRDRWGRGLMREALGPVIALARDALHLQALRAEIDAGNARSQRLFGALGFRPCAPAGYRLAL